LNIPFTTEQQQQCWFSAHRVEQCYGVSLTVVSYEGREWFLGVDLAHMMIQETYNFYRSLKLHHVPIHKCTVEQIQQLLDMKVLHIGVHNATLISHRETLRFLDAKRSGTVPRKRTTAWDCLVQEASAMYLQDFSTDGEFRKEMPI
jgi:hypothetical protein